MNEEEVAPWRLPQKYWLSKKDWGAAYPLAPAHPTCLPIIDTDREVVAYRSYAYPQPSMSKSLLPNPELVELLPNPHPTTRQDAAA